MPTAKESSINIIGKPTAAAMAFTTPLNSGVCTELIVNFQSVFVIWSATSFGNFASSSVWSVFNWTLVNSSFSAIATACREKTIGNGDLWKNQRNWFRGISNIISMITIYIYQTQNWEHQKRSIQHLHLTFLVYISNWMYSRLFTTKCWDHLYNCLLYFRNNIPKNVSEFDFLFVYYIGSARCNSAHYVVGCGGPLA